MLVVESQLSKQFAAAMRRLEPNMDFAVEWAVRLLSHAVGEGQACLDLSAWAGQEFAPGCYLPGLEQWRQCLKLSLIVGVADEFKPLIVEGDSLYLSRYWQYEQRLAENLLIRAGGLCEDVDLIQLRADLDRLFAHNAGHHPDWQKIAAATAVLRRFCVISGGPGTGKTATLLRILAAMQAQAKGGLRIVLAAPTGKAAARMQDSIRAQKQTLAMSAAIIESIPETATTLHRLLGSRPDSVKFRHHRDNPLSADVVIVDEASMVDLALMSKLVDALMPKARLILLGDKDQLCAVEAGAVFADLCAGQGYSPSFQLSLQQATSMDVRVVQSVDAPLRDCTVSLVHSHRFGADSGIGELARRINHIGGADSALAMLVESEYGDEVQWRPNQSEASLLERLEGAYQAYFAVVNAGADAAELMAAFNQFRLLAAHGVGPASAASVNQAFEARLRERMFIPRHERWYPGRPVMVMRNEYGLRVFNGDVGICLRVGGGFRICFEDGNGKRRELSPARLPEHEPVYAMTVHKSQGSEFGEVLLLLPEAQSPALNRALIYTAITRARSRVEIWG